MAANNTNQVIASKMCTAATILAVVALVFALVCIGFIVWFYLGETRFLPTVAYGSVTLSYDDDNDTLSIQPVQDGRSRNLGSSATTSKAGSNNSISIPLTNISQTTTGYFQGYAVANVSPGSSKQRLLAARLASSNGNPVAHVLLPPGSTVSSYIGSSSLTVTFFLSDVGIAASN
jgi:hypothetical protein